MTNASNSTKLKANEKLDSRPNIFGRTVTSTFRKEYGIKHKPPGNIRTCWIPPIVFGSALLNLPKLLKLRFHLKKERKERLSKNPDDVSVLYYSDNLDETNGIANNLRNVIPYMRAHGLKAFLAGSAFNTRPCGVVENSYCMLLPRMFSMEQLGYANSELAIPRVGPVLRLMKRYPVDIIELETPSPGAWLIAICGIIAGVKVMSHYRTDVPQYTRTLVKAKWMHAYVLWLMQVFYWMARPVISPCDDYSDALVNELKVPRDQVKLMPRGLPLERFQPDMRGKGTWEKFGSTREQRKVRFAFIGRISKEKNLEFLNNVWKKFAARHDDVELMYVGYGWYLEEIKKYFEGDKSVSFAGEQGGETLSGLYADADFFLFPSTTDTFGNVVVEAMSTGTPAVVSNYGGPRNIVDNEKYGWILPIEEDKWLDALENCRTLKLERESGYEQMRKDCHERSKRYTLENSSKSQFEFFRQVAKKHYKL
ncbi:Glycosyltransferase involved in cell wall bisynthesis [Fibrobacter sp. UWH9]|uniref:glycosyltransferase n=1 Tax=unclassified Fibrobacter TaxID=2634177 RepID=UPI00091F9DC9|nr:MULTISPECIES: glycosyltransferase [Fibrobacter]MCQ2099075.1 glycosyltransferase [Fibrobacter sp.]MCL4101346.1 D-inositol-3-phosphate glycosyltransferase [Fibrobacter succinogenes]OWV07642.1 glycosyl transferase family 1 [Fibrobacter sp. UWH3]OWV17434.1 glycosyl transferase family 1 [Fibrobacter sp. UWH1]SHH04745.1 Glycosyltransferase involved in cell wall bisynthesis [Fibrobacter sp. UWH9]